MYIYTDSQTTCQRRVCNREIYVCIDAYTGRDLHTYLDLYPNRDLCISIQIRRRHVSGVYATETYVYIYIGLLTERDLKIYLDLYPNRDLYVCTHIQRPKTVRERACMQQRPMGWARLVGSLKLYVYFAEYGFFYRALLQKRHIIWRSLQNIIWRSLPIVATPYASTHIFTET